METQQQDEFVRSPILEHRVFFLTSSCSYCGYLILAGSAEELIDEEERHAMESTARHGTVRLVLWRAGDL